MICIAQRTPNRDSIYYTMYQLIHNADSTAYTHHYESPRLHRNQATICITQINIDNNTQITNGDFYIYLIILIPSVIKYTLVF